MSDNIAFTFEGSQKMIKCLKLNLMCLPTLQEKDKYLAFTLKQWFDIWAFIMHSINTIWQ